MTDFSLRRIIGTLKERGQIVSASSRLPASVAAITDDSRRVNRGDLFIAVSGTESDGHRFLEQARERGARAAIVQIPGSTSLPHVVVRDTRVAAAVAAATFYRFPASELRLIGVTGTNGKTTTVNILRHLLDHRERRAASIGTLGVLVGAEGDARGSDAGGTSASLTTPGPIELQRILRALVDQGVQTVAMEVSSHSLDQRRVEGVEFDAAVFTNLSRDHIDYHQSMENYFAAKARLMELLHAEAPAVINADDSQWNKLPTGKRRIVRFGTDAAGVDVRAEGIRYEARGSSWTLAIGEAREPVTLPLIGDFNVANALAAAASAWALGMAPSRIAALLGSAPQVPGRMERLSTAPVVLRDYAHTPDALERALTALRPFAPRGVLVVFGCGGDRDRGKRPLMGGIATRLADHVIITSDNPRTENPETILDEIQAGMSGTAYERIEDRRGAISRALDRATQTGETVLLAGKGHETYQIRGTERMSFDEKEIVASMLGAS